MQYLEKQNIIPFFSLQLTVVGPHGVHGALVQHRVTAGCGPAPATVRSLNHSTEDTTVGVSAG